MESKLRFGWNPEILPKIMKHVKSFQTRTFKKSSIPNPNTPQGIQDAKTGEEEPKLS